MEPFIPYGINSLSYPSIPSSSFKHLSHTRIYEAAHSWHVKAPQSSRASLFILYFWYEKIKLWQGPGQGGETH